MNSLQPYLIMSALWGPPEFGASLGEQTLLWCSVPRLVTRSATLLQCLLWALRPVTSARTEVFKVRIQGTVKPDFSTESNHNNLQSQIVEGDIIYSHFKYFQLKLF